MWPDLDKIATEMIVVANLSQKPPKEHIQNRPKSVIFGFVYILIHRNTLVKP